MSHEEKNEWGLTPAEWAEYVEAMKPNKLKDPADCHPHLTAVWKSAEAVVVHLLRERLIVSTAFLMVDFTCIIMYSHIGYFDVRPSSKKELIASGKTFMDSTRNNRSCRVSLRCKTCGIKACSKCADWLLKAAEKGQRTPKRFFCYCKWSETEKRWMPTKQ